MQSFPTETDVLIIGAGIVGLAQAWAASRSGHRVVVLERSTRCSAASVRNFGMIWPIGQPAGTRLELAMASRQRWMELADRTGMTLRRCGSLFVATEADEAEVMREFDRDSHSLGYRTRLVNRDEAGRLSSLVRDDRVIAGLYSESELNIDPREAVPALASYLQTEHNVTVCWDTGVAAIDDDQVILRGENVIRANRILVCQGADACQLFPEHVGEREGLVACKLQMLRTNPLGRDMGVMLATGLTLRHYPAFAHCPSLTGYQSRLAEQSPELDRDGIHVMVSQDASGRLILGDSHQYGEHISPYREESIDRLILDQLNQRFELSHFPIDQRWEGRYLKRPGFGVWIDDVTPRVRIINGMGGNGMTLSFGVADRMWSNWDDRDLLEGLPDTRQRISSVS